MKKMYKCVLILVFFVSIISCSNDDAIISQTSNEINAEIIENSIIDLPGCISLNELTGKTITVKPGNASEAPVPIQNIYNGIRQNIGALEKWTNIIKKLLKNISNIIDFGSSGDWVNDSPENEYDPSRIVWGPAGDNSEFENKVEVYWNNAEGIEELGFQAFVTIDRDNSAAKGIFIWDFSIAHDESNPSNNAIVKFEFDATVTPKTLDIQAVGIDNTNNSNEPENAWVSATLDANHIFTLSGSYYFENILLINDSITPRDVENRNYTFTVIGFEDYVDLTKKMESQKNKAILNLALPPGDLDNIDGLWDTYSVSNIFCNIFKDYLVYLELTVPAIEFFTGLDLENGNLDMSIDDLTPDQIIEILEWIAKNKEHPYAVKLKHLLFVMDLVNPAYFINSGFLGTWDGSRGTLECAPSGFDDLDISTVEPIVPSEVLNLQIDFF